VLSITFPVELKEKYLKNCIEKPKIKKTTTTNKIIKPSTNPPVFS
jgi:hypothetical protein